MSTYAMSAQDIVTEFSKFGFMDGARVPSNILDLVKELIKDGWIVENVGGHNEWRVEGIPDGMVGRLYYAKYTMEVAGIEITGK